MRPSGLARVAIFVVATLSVGITPSPLYAVDVVGDPPPEYLQESVRPNWRLRPLSDSSQLDVLDEIEQWISKPLSRSDAVEDLAFDVFLLEENRLPLIEVLELLERTQDLHFTAEPLRLVVQTGEERRALERRLVDLGLRDFGFFFNSRHLPFAIDPVLRSDQRPSGPGTSRGGASSIIDFGGDDEGNLSFDIDRAIDIVEEMLTSRFTSDDDTSNVELRRNGNLLVNVSPLEEARLRTALTSLYEIQTRRSQWRVNVGRVPRSFQVEGGIVPATRAREIVEVLEDRRAFNLNAFDGQEVASSRYAIDRNVDDVEVNQTGVFPVMNPVFENDLAGVFVQIRPTLGLQRRLVELYVDWVETDSESRSEVTILSPPAGKVVEKEKAPSESGDVGRKYAVNLEERWEWKHHGAVFLREAEAMVWIQSRGGSQVAVILEEVSE